MWGNDPLNGSNGSADIEESYLKLLIDGLLY